MRDWVLVSGLIGAVGLFSARSHIIDWTGNIVDSLTEPPGVEEVMEDLHLYNLEKLIELGLESRHKPAIAALGEEGFKDYQFKTILEIGLTPDRELVAFYRSLNTHDVSPYRFINLLKAGAKPESK